MEQLLNYLGDHWFNVVIILTIAWLGRHFGGVIIERIVRGIVKQTKYNDLSHDDMLKRQNTLIGLLTVIWRTLVVVIAALLLFRELFPSINLAPLFASAGIIGIAIGFGAQSLIKDFLSGIFIISDNQYRVGDVVEIEGAGGTVERVGIRSTVLRDADGNVHYLPNGMISHVINKTMGYSKVNFTIAVDPDTDVDTLASVINEVGTKMAEDSIWKDRILEAPRFISIGTFSHTMIEVTIGGKTQPSAQWSVTSELRRRLLRAFKKHAIVLATPLTAAAPSRKK